MFTLMGRIWPPNQDDRFTLDAAQRLIGQCCPVNTPSGQAAGLVVEATLEDGGAAILLRLEVDGNPEEL